MKTTIDLTPTWGGVLRLLLTAYEDGSSTGRKTALEELCRMAALADAYVKQQGKHKSAAQAGGFEDLLTDDTQRVEAGLLYLTQYGEELDRQELAPNGDDFNNLNNGLIAILRDGTVPPAVDLSGGR